MSVFADGHALVVGIANYQNVRKLPAVDDAAAISDVLTDSSRGGYPRDNVTVLADGDATRAALVEALGDLADRTDPESTVLIYFSGHGGRIEKGPHAGEYLIPVDGVYPPEAALVDSTISGTEFTAALNALPARKVVVLFDCCHAGGIGEPRTLDGEVFEEGFPDSFYDVLKSGRGRVIFASSRGNEYSYVPAGADYGLFTEHLVAGLRGACAGDDGYVRIFDLFEYLQPKVTANQPNQHPVFKAEVEENFVIAARGAPPEPEMRPRDDGYRYDAYVSYVDREPDATWVWDTLIPHMEGAGLTVAVSHDVAEPGVARVVNVERGLRQAKRTIVVLSTAYLDDHMADFENVLSQTMGIDQGTYPLIPVRYAELDATRLPMRLAMLTPLDFTSPQTRPRQFDRLVRALRSPVPKR